jgi:hypothetical protein
MNNMTQGQTLSIKGLLSHPKHLFPLNFKLTKLALWFRALLENLIVTQLVKKFPALYGTRRFVTVFIRVRITFLKKLFFFYGEELLTLRSTLKMQDHPLSAVCD